MCEPDLEIFKRREFSAWKGLPDCPMDDVLKLFPLAGAGVGSGRLGGHAASFRALSIDTYPRPVLAWFEGDRLLMLDAEYPDPARNLRDELERLGRPEARLDCTWEIHQLREGEWIYPARGLAAIVNPGNGVVLRLFAFSPTTLDAYLQELRVPWGYREFPES